jgi:hypothetical protein
VVGSSFEQRLAGPRESRVRDDGMKDGRKSVMISAPVAPDGASMKEPA